MNGIAGAGVLDRILAQLQHRSGDALTIQRDGGFIANSEFPAPVAQSAGLDQDLVEQRPEIGGLGAHEAGVFNIRWDGVMADGTKAADGNYTFSVEAVQGGNKVTATALQIGTVSALVRSSNGFLLDLGTLGTVDFSDVQQIL